ncbi:hypothetical protein BDW62DRAFT_172410 [Aspergillus aurantiobrunneus]
MSSSSHASRVCPPFSQTFWISVGAGALWLEVLDAILLEVEVLVGEELVGEELLTPGLEEAFGRASAAATRVAVNR